MMEDFRSHILSVLGAADSFAASKSRGLAASEEESRLLAAVGDFSAARIRAGGAAWSADVPNAAREVAAELWPRGLPAPACDEDIFSMDTTPVSVPKVGDKLTLSETVAYLSGDAARRCTLDDPVDDTAYYRVRNGVLEVNVGQGWKRSNFDDEAGIATGTLWTVAPNEAPE